MDGFYINLDHSTQRRADLDAQLARLGFDWMRRLPAIDGQDLQPRAHSPLAASERACFLSHVQALATPSADEGALRLVLEDDVQLAQDLPSILQGFGTEQFEAWDIVFLECQPWVTTGALMTLWQSLAVHGTDADTGRVAGANLYDAADIYQWGMTAYLTTPHGRERIVGLLREAWDRGPVEPCDIAVRRLVQEGRVRAAVVAPFLATPSARHHAASTLVGREASTREHRVHEAIRRLFFAGPWHEMSAWAEAAAAAPERSGDRRLDLLADLMAREFIAVARRNMSTGVRW